MIGEALAVGGDLVVVGVDPVEVGGLVQEADGFPEGFGGEVVVVVEQGDEVAGGEFEGFLGGAGDAAVVGADDEADLGGVAGGEVVEKAAEVRAVGAVVDGAEFPVGIDLAFDGEKAVGEVGRVGFVDGEEDGDEGAPGPGAGLAGAFFSFGAGEEGTVGEVPLIIGPGAGVVGEARGAIAGAGGGGGRGRGVAAATSSTPCAPSSPRCTTR